MYQAHTLCIPPEKESTKIWRYMDMTKLLAMLEDQALWFSDITCLKEDPLEGFLTRATVREFRKLPDGLSAAEEERTKEVIEENLQFIKKSRNLLNVSSWHMNEHESAAMWRLYSKNNEGVAIQSTYKRLCESVKDAEEKVNIGVIKYVDEENDTFNWRNVIHYALHKRKSFEHEKELRAIVFSPSEGGGGHVKVDLKTIIEKVYVAPNSPNWVHELIKKIMKRYGLGEIPVEKSTLNNDPLY